MLLVLVIDICVFLYWSIRSFFIITSRNDQMGESKLLLYAIKSCSMSVCRMLSRDCGLVL